MKTKLAAAPSRDNPTSYHVGDKVKGIDKKRGRQ